MDLIKAKNKAKQGPVQNSPLGSAGGGGASGIAAAASSLGQAMQANPNVGAPQQGTREHPETARFRSFAERYMIARAHNFREDHIKDDQWKCILDAKAAYAMIARTGQNINPQIGDDTF